MRVESLRRYPVKSMLGEVVPSMFIDERGASGDRRLALVDSETHRIASAKQPRLWRKLLQFTASGDTGQVCIRLPDGGSIAADDPGIDEVLSKLVGRSVSLVSKRPRGATLERPDPETVLELGEDAEVAGQLLEIGHATPETRSPTSHRCMRSPRPPCSTSAPRRCVTDPTCDRHSAQLPAVCGKRLGWQRSEHRRDAVACFEANITMCVAHA